MNDLAVSQSGQSPFNRCQHDRPLHTLAYNINVPFAENVPDVVLRAKSVHSSYV